MSQADTGIKNKLKKVKANCFLMPEIFLIPCQLKKKPMEMDLYLLV